MRPTKYDPTFCDEARAFISQGYSVVGFAGSIGVCKATIYNWMEEHPEFLAAVKAGQAGAVQWWEDRARDIAMGGDGNATMTIFGLKNRAAAEWRDKSETEHSGGVKIDGIAMTFVASDPKAKHR